MKDYSKLFMDIAVRTAEESNCIKYHVGAVIVKDNRVILQGYNGTIPGFTNCSDKFKGTDTKDAKIREIHNTWSNYFEIHAEMNVISYAARKGIPLEGTTIFCTHSPCNNCIKHLIQAGVKKIVFKVDYINNTDFPERKELLKFIQIEKYTEK